MPSTYTATIVAVEIICTNGPMRNDVCTACIHALRYAPERLSKILIFSFSRTNDWVTRMPLMLSEMYAFRFDCLLLCILQARRCRFLSANTYTMKIGRPQSTTRV